MSSGYRGSLNLESLDEEDVEETRSRLESSRPSFKILLLRNQVVVSLLQYATSACIMFIPSTFKYYEMATEGCYSVSQLIQFFNGAIIESVLEKCQKFEDYCVLVTRGISHIEVLIEKSARLVLGVKGHTLAVMVVEMLKSLLRLFVLINRRAPAMLLHWERNRRPDNPKLDLAHYSRWYRLAYAHHRSNGRSSEDIINGFGGGESGPRGGIPVADARALDDEEDRLGRYNNDNGGGGTPSRDAKCKHLSSQGGMGEEEELELVTAPIKGRRSGLRIGSIRIRAAPGSSTSSNGGGGGEITQAKTTSDASHPDFGIYADLSRSPPGLPLAQPVLSPSQGGGGGIRGRVEGEEEEDEGGFRYLPHTVSSTRPSSDTDQDGSSNSNGNSGPRGGRSGSGSGRVKDIEREKREERESRASRSLFGLPLWGSSRPGPSTGGDDGSTSSSRGNDSEGEDEEEERNNDTFDRDMYVHETGGMFGGAFTDVAGGDMDRGYGSGSGSGSGSDSERGEYGYDEVNNYHYPLKRKRERDNKGKDRDKAGRRARSPDISEYEDASQDGGGGSGGSGGSGGRVAGRGEGAADTAGAGSGNNPGAGGTLPAPSGLLTPEQYLYLGEVLYILRPAVYAWAVHYVGTVASSQGQGSSSAAATSTAVAESYDSDEEDWIAPAPAPAPASQTASGSGSAFSSEDNGNDNGATHLLPYFDQALLSAPWLRYVANDGHELQKAVAIAMSFLIEVLSVQLTARGLELSRAKGAWVYDVSSASAMSVEAAGPVSEKERRVTLKKLSRAYPHEFDAELSRRRTALFFYLIRSPMFDRATLPILHVAARMLSSIPFISSLPDHAVAMLSYLNRTHFYNSASS